VSTAAALVLADLTEKRPDITPSPAYPGLAIRAGHLENA
jgi:hypothetical protein